MSASSDIVVAAENNHYLMWQAMLFHYSCQHHLGRAPLIVVHADEGPLLPGFERIQAAGGRVQRVPNFRRTLGVDYPALNTATTLLHAQTDADYVVLCDSDLVFLRPVPFEEHALASHQLSFDAVNYLRVDSQTLEWLEEPRRSMGIEVDRLEAFAQLGGVPHIVPNGLRKRLAEEWMHCVELFVPAPESGEPMPWVAMMWALVFATIRLELEPLQTHFSISNHRGARPLPEPSPSMIHYCYGDETFDKRRFGYESTSPGVWKAEAPAGSINEAVCAQLRAARAFYDVPTD